MVSRVIDQEWSDERGGLHDARITQVAMQGEDLLIFIDNEWANEAGLEGYPGKSQGVIYVQGLKSPPRVDDMVLRERVGDVFIESGDCIKLTIICFGQYVLEATGKQVHWQSAGD